MQMKILGAVVIATGLALAGCGGSSGSSGSTGSTGTTTNTTSANTSGTSTTGTNASTSGSNTSTTGTNTSSTGGSTTGTNSSNGSTTGTSGTTSGPGTTDTNCGANHVACSGDDHCHDYAPDLGLSASQHLYLCGCSVTTLGDGGSVDSCSGNSDGNLICDSDLGHCRPPRDYEAAGQGTGGFICDNGYVPVNNGTDVVCIGTCTATTDCKANFVACVPDSLTTDDGGSIGACLENDCGPDLQNYPTYDDGGVIEYEDGGHVLYDDGGVQTVPGPLGQYYASCDINGANNNGTGSGGTCLPIPVSDNQYLGICWRDGTAQLNDGCTGLFGQVTDQAGSTTLNSCGAGLYCLSGTGGVAFPSGSVFPNQPDAGGPTIFTATCIQACNAAPEADGGPTTLCPTVNGTAQTCTAAFSTDPDVNGLQWGICL